MMYTTSSAHVVVPDSQGQTISEIRTTSQSETLTSLCEWWTSSKKEALPGICHWFVPPQETGQEVTKFHHGQESHINPYSTNNNTISTDTYVIASTEPSAAGISIIFIIAGFFFIIFFFLFIICITFRKRSQESNAESYLNSEVSSQLDRIRSANILHLRFQGTKQKDSPPDYTTVINMKKREDEYLPSYSEAVATDTGNKKTIQLIYKEEQNRTEQKSLIVG